MNNLVFVCGHRKCGTTMFSDLFNGHQKLSVFPTDLSIFYGYYPKYVDGSFSEKEQLERLENVIFLNLERALDEHMSRRNNHMMLLWQALNLELWFREWIDG